MSKINFGSGYFTSKLMASVILLVLLILFGWSGYFFYFQYGAVDALYMTIITIGTVGFGEVHPLDDQGKIFTSILIILSGVIFAFAISNISAYLINVHTFFNFKIKKMNHTIEHLKGHVIVCGYGRNGKQAANKLKLYKQAFVVIENDETAIASLTEEGIPYIEGNATEDNVLLKAGISRSKFLILTLPSDADNVFITLAARQYNADMTIISRASDETSLSKLRIAGVNNIIMPDKIGGDHMASLIVSPDLLEFLDNLSTSAEGRMNLREIILSDISEIKTLSELKINEHTGCNIVGYKTDKNEYIINPDPNQILHPKGRIIVLGRTEQLKSLQQYFNLD